MNYLPRIVDSELDLRLRAVGATVIVGPKWCGKTTTAKQKARSVLEMQDPDLQEGYLKLAATKPSLLLEGANPRLIDEWQLAPVLWDAVRVSVDRRKEKGLYLLTGSVVVDENKIKHTGIGRISRYTERYGYSCVAQAGVFGSVDCSCGHGCGAGIFPHGFQNLWFPIRIPRAA